MIHRLFNRAVAEEKLHPLNAGHTIDWNQYLRIDRRAALGYEEARKRLEAVEKQAAKTRKAFARKEALSWERWS